MSRIKNLLLTAVLVFVGLGTAGWYGPSLLVEARATESWPAVTGRVLEARPVSQGSGGQRRDSVVVTYEYAYEGQTHRGDRYAVGGQMGANSTSQAQQLARSFRPGDEVQVYVDPEDPTSAVLARGGSRKAWMTLGFGACLVLDGLYVGARRVL